MNNRYSSGNQRKELYRNPSRGKIFGICAGLADYFGLEIWVVRIIAVSALIFLPNIVSIAYIIAYFVLEPHPGMATNGKGSRFRNSVRDGFTSFSGYHSTDKDQNNTDYSSATVQQVWKKGSVTTQNLKHLNKHFKRLENRLQSLEKFVTSKQFQLSKEFENLGS